MKLIKKKIKWRILRQLRRLASYGLNKTKVALRWVNSDNLKMCQRQKYADLIDKIYDC